MAVLLVTILASLLMIGFPRHADLERAIARQRGLDGALAWTTIMGGALARLRSDSTKKEEKRSRIDGGGRSRREPVSAKKQGKLRKKTCPSLKKALKSPKFGAITIIFPRMIAGKNIRDIREKMVINREFEAQNLAKQTVVVVATPEADRV